MRFSKLKMGDVLPVSPMLNLCERHEKTPLVNFNLIPEIFMRFLLYLKDNPFAKSLKEIG